MTGVAPELVEPEEDDGDLDAEPDVTIPWADILKAVPSEALVNEILRDDRASLMIRVLMDKHHPEPYEASPEQVARHQETYHQNPNHSFSCRNPP